MKSIFYLLLVGLIASSCATTKTAKAPSPAGNWDYMISGTPEGDFTGVLTIAEVDKTFTANLNSNAGDLPIEKFVYDKETKKMTGELYYNGTPVLFDAAMEGENLTGTMSAGGMNFPFKATRKK